MALQKYKIGIISDLVFIILWPFLKIINIDINYYNHHKSNILKPNYHKPIYLRIHNVI